MDSSGIEFAYTNTPPLHKIGVFSLSHSVSPIHVIPPRTDNFITKALCPGECLQEVSIIILYNHCSLLCQYINVAALPWHKPNLLIVFLVWSTQFLPPEGITVFGNFLHTHLAGMLTILQVFRIHCYTTSPCTAIFLIL